MRAVDFVASPCEVCKGVIELGIGNRKVPCNFCGLWGYTIRSNISQSMKCPRTIEEQMFTIIEKVNSMMHWDSRPPRWHARDPLGDGFFLPIHSSFAMKSIKQWYKSGVEDYFDITDVADGCLVQTKKNSIGIFLRDDECI